MSSLNASFKETVGKALEKNSSVDLAFHIFPQYQVYLSRIKSRHGVKTEPHPSQILPKLSDVKLSNPLFDHKKPEKLEVMSIESSRNESKEPETSFVFLKEDTTKVNELNTDKNLHNSGTLPSSDKDSNPFGNADSISSSNQNQQVEGPAFRFFETEAKPKPFPSPSPFNLDNTQSSAQPFKFSFPQMMNPSTFNSEISSTESRQIPLFTNILNSSSLFAPFSNNTLDQTSKLNDPEDENIDDDYEDSNLRRSEEDNPMIKVGAGEEKDNTVFDARSKLFSRSSMPSNISQSLPSSQNLGSLSSSGWDDLGIGISKVNICPDERKRFIFRLEGSGKTLINNWIDSSFSAELRGKDLFIVAPDSHGQVKKFLLRLKDASIAQNLLSAIKKDASD